MDQRLTESFSRQFKISLEQVVREEYELLVLQKLLEGPTGHALVLKGAPRCASRTASIFSPLAFATPKRSRQLTLGETSVRFHQLKGELFFGYTLEDGLYVAEPEKALLDQCYLASRGLAELAWEELDLAALD